MHVWHSFSHAQLQAFLDQRGEDYDDCHDFNALVDFLSGHRHCLIICLVLWIPGDAWKETVLAALPSYPLLKPSCPGIRLREQRSVSSTPGLPAKLAVMAKMDRYASAQDVAYPEVNRQTLAYKWGLVSPVSPWCPKQSCYLCEL